MTSISGPLHLNGFEEEQINTKDVLKYYLLKWNFKSEFIGRNNG